MRFNGKIPPFCAVLSHKKILLLLLFCAFKLVHAQSISNTRVNSLNSNIHFCLGGTYTVTFDTLGTTGSIFTVQLSDASGSFITNTNLDSSSSKSINITIPPSSNLSTNYSLRVVRRAGPAIIGNTLTNLTITKPAPSFSFNNFVCAGTNVNFTNNSIGNGVGILNYIWNFSATAGAPSSTSNASPTVSFNPANGSGTINYSITLTATDSFGCTHTANNTVTIRQKPIPNFTITNNNACAGSNVSFTNTSIGASPLSYSWDFSGPTGAPNSTNTSSPTLKFNPAFGNSPVLYLTTLTVTDIYNCNNSITNNVFINPLPQAIISPNIATLGNFTAPSGSSNLFRKCTTTTPNTLTINNLSSTASSNTNYLINWGDGSSNFNSNSLPNNTTHTYTNLGSFSLNLQVTNSFGCISSNSYTVFAGSNPQFPSITVPGGSTQGFCVEKSWNFQISNFSTNTPGTIYNITSNDIGPETSYVHPPPSNYLKNYTFNSCGYSYSTGSTVKLNSFFLKIEAVNPCGFGEQLAGPIQLSSKPIADFTFNPTTKCVNQVISFFNTSIKGRYIDPLFSNVCDTTSFPEWEITPSSGWIVNSGVLSPVGSATDNINIIFNTIGTYSIKLKVLNPSSPCGLDSITKTICIQPRPIPSFTFTNSPSNRCTNNTLSIINTSNTLTSCGTTTYNWTILDSLNNNAIISPGTRFSYVTPSRPDSINPVFLFTQSGIYKIRLQVTNICGTVAKDTFIIIKDKPIVSLPSARAYCDAQTIIFSSANVNHTPVINPNYGTISAYSWSVSPAGSSFTSGTASSANPTISFPNTTTLPITYTVTLTATNECGVSNVASQQITINPRPQATASAIPSKLAFCSGGTSNIVLSNNLSSIVRYTWRAYPSSNKISGFSNQFIGVTGPITQTLINTGSVNETVLYRIVAKDTLTGCLGDSTSIIITVYPIPRVFASAQNICSGAQTNIALSSNVAGTLFTWTAIAKVATTGFRDTSNAVRGPIINTLVNASASGDTVIYTIRAIANGCVSPDTIIKVTVSPIPSALGGSASICSSDTAKFTPSSLVFGTSFTYTASLINGNATGFSNGNGSISQALTNTGNTNALVRYTITPRGPLPTLCVGQPVNFDVTVKPKPILTVTSASSICSGSQTNIVLNSGVAGTLYQYNATLLSGTNTSGFYSKTTDTLSPISQVITNIGSTNAVVRYYITPIANACKGDSLLHEVTVYPGVIAGTVGTAATVCSGSNAGTLNLSGNTGAVVRWEQSVAPFTNWSIINNVGATQNYLNLTQTTWYRAVIQSGGLCPTVNTLPVIITVDSVSIAGNLTGTDTVCTGINSGLLTLINKRGTIVNWQLSNGLPTWNNIGTTAVNPYSYANLTQTTWFRVLVQNGVCPLAISDSVRIQVDALPSAAIAPNKQICATSLTLGTNDNITANPISTGMGLWTYLSGPNTPTIVSPNASTSAINNLAIGTHFILWQVSNGKCPSSKDTLNLVVYPPIQSSISDSQVICSGQAPTTLIGTLPTGGNGIYIYQWQSSIDGINWVDIVSATNKDYQPSTLTSSTWYRRKVVSNVCNQTSNLVYIQVLPSISNNTITPNAAICIGGNSPTLIGSIPNGGNSTYTYQWQKYNGANWINAGLTDTLKDYNPGILLNTTVFRRIVSSSFCNGLQAHTSNTVTITINPLPVVNAGGDSSKCQNQTTYNLNGSPAGGTWSGIGVLNNTFNPSAMPLGTYTLVYTFTNANGCTNRDTTLINVIAIPNVDAGNNISVCQNEAAFQLSGFTPSSGGSWSGPAITSGGIFDPGIAGAGIFKLFYNFTAGTGCSGIDSLLVTVNPKPSPDFTRPPQICPNNSIVLTTTTNTVATVSGYNWIVTNNGSLSNNILSSYNTANPIATFPENKTGTDITYSIKLITITNNGCIDSVSKTIVLLRRPFAQFTTGSNINCGPAVYTLTNGTSNVTSSYVWSTNPSASVNINTATSNAPQITFPVNSSTAAIVYNIQLIATRNDGIASCKDTAIVPITVYPKPIISFTSLPSDSGCSPLTVNFSNTSNPQNTENINTMSFLWNFGIYGTDTARNPQRTFTNTGIVDSITNVKVIGTSKWGCKDSLTQKITVFPFPKANFSSGNYAYCAPLTIDSSNITLVPYPIANSQYLWQIINKAGNILSSHTGTGIPTYTINTPNDTIYYRLITSHTRGCKPDTLTRMFITIANPTPNFSMSDSVGCTPLSINISNTSTPNLTYIWTISNGAIPVNTNPFALTFTNSSNTVNKTDSVKLVIIAGTGCRDSITKYISVYPKPKAIFSLPNIICADTFKTATNASVFKGTSASYIWNFLNNTNNSISNTTAPTPVFTFINNQTGIDSNYTIRLRVTSTDGCVHDTTQNITIYKRPLAVFSVPITTCGPANALISNSTALNSNWSWISFPALSFNTATSPNPVVTFPLNNTADSINYRIKLTATRAGYTCVDTTDRWVTIYPKPQAAFTTITKDSCGPRLVNFTNTSNAKNGESAGSMSYLWTILNNTFSSTNASATFTNSGVVDALYNIRLIATSKHGCIDSTKTNVTVWPNPKADFSSTIYSSCAPFVINNSIVTLTQYPNANDLYTWQILDKLGVIISSSTGTSIPVFTINAPNETFYYRLITSHSRGCKTDTLTRMFVTIANPVPNFTAIDSIGCTPLSVTFNNTSTIGVISSWTFSNGFLPPNPNSFSTTFNNFLNTRDTTYTVKLVITAGSGCKDSLTKNIIVYPKPKAIFSLPNIICADTFKTATNASVFKGTSASYIWNFLNNTNNSISNTTAPTPVFTFINNQTGIDSNYTIRLRVTSTDGCVHDTSKIVTIYSRPLAVFTVPTTYCGPKNDTIINTTALNSNWSWISFPSLSFNTATSKNPVVTFPLNNTTDSINYRIKLTATRAGYACVDTTDRWVTIYPKPAAAFTTITKDSCGPRLVNFTNTSNAKNGESAGSMSYLWTILNNTFSSTNASATFTNAGTIDSTYNARLIATSKHGCKDTTNTIVTVYPDAKALFNFSINTACAPFVINAINVIAVDYPNANSQYKWYANNNLIGITSTFPGYTLSTANDSVLIKLVTTSLRGCKNDSMQVWFRTIPNPKPNFTAIDSIGCTPLSVTFNNTSTIGVISSWTFSNGFLPPNPNSFNTTFNNFLNTRDTTYTVKLVITAGSGCKDSLTKNIIVYPKPKAIFSLPNIICADTFKTATNASVFKGTSVSYIWNFLNNTNNSISNTTAPTPVFTFINNQTGIDSNYTIRLRVTSTDGCVHDTTQNITIYKRPLAVFSVPITTCGPANVTISNTTALNSNWSWISFPSLSFNTATSPNPVVTFPLNNTVDSINYRIKLTATRADYSCVDTTDRWVTIYPKPQAAFTTITKDSCGPRLVNFTNTSNANNGESAGSMSYLWTILNNTFSSTNASATFTNAGTIDSTYNARLIATSKHGCKDTTNTIVTVYPDAKALFNFSINTACAPFVINASNVIAVDYPNANSQYKWYRNDTLIGTGLNFPTQTIARANDSILIKLVTTSLRGCKNDSMQVWFRTIPNPKPNFTAIDSIGCTPLSVTFNNTSTIGVISSWTFSNGFLPPNPNSFNTTFNNFLNTRDTTYTVKLVITAGSGCKDSLTKNIIVYPKPKAIFSLPNIICADTFKTATNASVFKGTSVSYIWNFLNNTNNSISNTTAPTPVFTFINNQTGIDSNYTIRLRVTSTDGCVHDTTQNITIYKRPLAVFSVPITTCGPANVTISNTTALNSNWSWISFPSLSFNTATSPNPVVTFPLNNTVDSINYRIKLTATRADYSCVDTTDRWVTIYPKPQAAFTTITKDSCGPRLVNFTNTSNANNGESAGSMSYLWTILNNTFSSTNASATFTNAGTIDSTYNARLIATSKHGCKDTTNTIVTVYPDAKALFNFSINTACAPFVINASNVIAVDYPNANSQYKWYRNDTLIGTGLNFPTQTIARANDSILIKLVTTSLRGCKNDSMQVWFRTIPNPKPNFTAIDSIGCTPLIVNFNNTSNPKTGVGFKWEFGNKLNVSTQTNPTFTFYNYGITDTIAFTKLIITANGTGCTDSITKPIVIKPLPRPALNLSDSILCYPNLLTVTNISFNVPLYDITGFKWKAVGPDLAILLNDTASQSTTIRFPDNKTGANKFYQIGLQIRSDYGCIDSTKKTVRIPTRPISSFNFSADSSCAPVIISTNNTAQYANTYRWSSIKPNVIINSASTINTSIIFPSHKGTFDSIYPIKLISQTIAGCFDTIVKPFKVFPLPIAGFLSDLDSGCSPLKIRIKNNTLAKKPTNNFWDFGDGSKQIINTDSFDRTFIGSIFNDTTYTIKLVSSSKDGCKDSTTKTIKVKSSAYAKIKLSDTILCSNAINPAKLKIENKSYGSVDTFYWDFGDGTQLITNKDTTINHPYPIEGLYTIRLKASNNCKTSFDSTQIKVLVPPIIHISKSDSVGCSPLNVTFTNNSTNVFEAKYIWNFGNGISSTLKNPPIITFLQSPTADTIYLIRLQISNACYTDSILDSIKVRPKPTVDFNLSVDSICSGSSIFVINNTIGLPDYLKWQFGNGDSSNRYDPLQNPIRYVSIDSTSYFRIKLFASNTCGSDSFARTLKVFPNKVKALFKSSGNFICVGDTVFFQNSSKGGNYFSWDFGDGSGIAPRFNASHVYQRAGTFITRLNVNDGCGFDTSSIEIKVNPIPQFNILKSNTQICVNKPVQFYASLQDSGTVIWYFGDGDSSIYRNPSHSYKNAGLKKIKVVMYAANSICTNIKYDSVYVNPLPTIQLSSDSNSACAYHIFNLKASSAEANVFSWDLGDSNTSSGTFVKHLYSQGGTYVIKVTAQTASNCIDTAYKSIVVYPVPSANFDYTPKDTCTGPVLVQFTNKSTGANNYSWTFGNGNVSTYNNPETTYTGVGSYPIELICSNQFACFDTAKAVYNVYQMPKADLEFDVNQGCPGLEVKFTNKSQFGTQYTWYFGDGKMDTSFNTKHIYLNAGTYVVKLLASNNGVCNDSIISTKQITVFSKPNPIYSANLIDLDRKPYRTVAFNINTDSIRRYEWQFGDGGFSNEPKPIHKYAEGDSGWFVYTIKVISLNGCDTSFVDSIYLPGYWKGLYVPNAFTPDYGTDEVRVFKPSGIELKTYHLKIFNKWGELLWESTLLKNGQPAEGWNGIDMKGNACMQGAYIWTIDAEFTDGVTWEGMEFSEGKKETRGNVTLIR
jgi:PKD repeat protein